MANKSTENRVSPVVAGLIVFGVAVVCGLVSIGMGFVAWDAYTAARGTNGVAGTITVKGKDTFRRSRPCVGSFQPDVSGSPHAEVTVHIDGECRPGRVAKARLLGDDEAYTKGGGGWITQAGISVGFGLAAMMFGGLGAIGVRNLRNRASHSATPESRP